jgi:hypothetical protein
MTSQQEADNLLSYWRLQRAAGVRPEERRTPLTRDEEFERDLEVIRAVMERK